MSINIDELRSILDKICDSIGIKTVRYNPVILTEIIKRYGMDRKVILTVHPGSTGEIDENRQGALVGHWIAKLKPVDLCVPRKHMINEILACGIALSRTFHNRKVPKIHKDIINNIIYALRYRLFPKESFSLVLRVIQTLP